MGTTSTARSAGVGDDPRDREARGRERGRHTELLGRLRAGSEAAADAMMEAIRREVPLYDALPDEALADTRRVALLAYIAVVRFWEEGRLALPDEMSAFRAMAADRARRDRPLPAVMRAYRVAAIATFDHIAEVGEGVLDAGDLRSLVRAVFGFLDQLYEVVTETYLDTARLVETRAERAVRDLADDLVTGRFVSGASLQERAAACGARLPEHPVVVVVGGPDEPGRPFAVGTGPPALSTRGGLVMVVDGPARPAIAEALRREGRRAVLVGAGDLVEVPGAFRLAAALLETPCDGRPEVLDDPDARVAGALQGLRPPLGAADVEAVLGLLVLPDQRRLVEALMALFDAGNAVSAAHRLDVHPQTLRHRLRRVRTLTGRDLSVGWDRFVVETALRAHVAASA